MVYGPDGSKIDQFLNHPTNKAKIENLCKESYMQYLDKKKEEKTAQNRMILNEKRDIESKKELLKPPIPVFDMTTRQIETFLPKRGRFYDA